MFRKRAYPSKDRGSDIIFDVVVEAFQPSAAEPSARWIWECKDYPDRRVKVDEVEEFYAKIDQIGPMNVIATMVTKTGFQEAAFNYAVSRRISLYVVEKRLVPVTQYDARVRTVDLMKFVCLEGLLPSGRRFAEMDQWGSLDMILRVELRSAGLLPPLDLGPQ